MRIAWRPLAPNCPSLSRSCTAYHRTARHLQEQRAPLAAWPAPQRQQLGRLLSDLNHALLHEGRLQEVQAHNLGLTLWCMSKTYHVPQEGADQLWSALQVGAARRRLANWLPCGCTSPRPDAHAAAPSPAV